MSIEHADTFTCFGGSCTVIVAGDGPLGPGADAVAAAREQLELWHARFTRFTPDSELSRVNADPRATVGVSALMARLAQAVVDAAHASDGLVDATLGTEIERAGYAASFTGEPLPLAAALAAAPPRRRAAGDPSGRWRQLSVDADAATITRPPGLRIDSGGLAKGLFADVLAAQLEGYDRYVVNLCGDLRLGGVQRRPRAIEVENPFTGDTAHRFTRTDGALATSGIGRRSWRDAGCRPAHHLLDPSSGCPAFTGVVQASALAPTALEAERLSKTALLAGPAAAPAALRHGGLLILDDGRVAVHEPPRAPARVTADVRGGRLRLSGLALPR